METRLGALEGAYKQVADRLNSIDARLDTLGSELRSEFRTGAASLASKTDTLGVELRAKMDSQFKWLVGILATGSVTAAGIWITTMQLFLGLAKFGHL